MAWALGKLVRGVSEVLARGVSQAAIKGQQWDLKFGSQPKVGGVIGRQLVVGRQLDSAGQVDRMKLDLELGIADQRC